MTDQNIRRRVGLIVPSSNITMETEIPALLHARESIRPDLFSFHSSRMRMKSVVKEELELMDNESMRCAIELSDAAVEVQAYACLVAIMSMGKGYHSTSREKLYKATLNENQPTSIVNSAGALIDALHTLGAKKIAFICPYMKPLAKLVADYIEDEGIEVHDMIALEIPDNLDVAAQDPRAPATLWKNLDTKGIDAIIASACVQMPSLPSIDMIERDSGIPTLSAAVATTRSILNELNLEPIAPMGGSLLSGQTIHRQQTKKVL